jgi:hypothetical protein
LLFSLLSARPSSRNRLIPISILVDDDIRLQLRPLDLAVVGNRAFTFIARQARNRNCACGLLPNATGCILSSLFYPLFLLRLSNPAICTCRSPQPKPSASCVTLQLRYLLRLRRQTRNCVLRLVLFISLASYSRNPFKDYLLSSSRCSRLSLWLNPCPFLQERFYTKAEEVERDVTMNVTNS